MKKRCLFGNCELDERQLLLRGNIYQHMLVVVLALLLVNGFLKDEGIVWAQGMWENLLIFWAGATLGLGEMILRDITPAGSRQNIVYILLGLCGGMLLILGSIHVFLEGQALAENGALTTLGAGLIQALCMAAVFLLFLGKWLVSRTRGVKDED